MKQPEAKGENPIEKAFNEGRLIAELEPESLRGRDGDWEHARRVVGWVKQLSEGRDDLPLLITAGYVHDLGWRDVIPPQKLTLDRLREYEPTANANSEPYITEFLTRLGYSATDVETVIRIVRAVDVRKGVQDDEKIVLDGDNLSKLSAGHVTQKFQQDEWLKMIDLWRRQLPTRIQTEEGRKLYPDLLDKLERDLKLQVQSKRNYQ